MNGWKERAVCGPETHSMFFEGQTKEAKKICATCPVRTPCLEFALRENMTLGVWGGTSPYERQKILKERNDPSDS